MYGLQGVSGLRLGGMCEVVMCGALSTCGVCEGTYQYSPLMHTIPRSHPYTPHTPTRLYPPKHQTPLDRTHIHNTPHPWQSFAYSRCLIFFSRST